MEPDVSSAKQIGSLLFVLEPKSELEKFSNIIILRIFVSFISYEIISDISEQAEEFLLILGSISRIIVAGRT